MQLSLSNPRVRLSRGITSRKKLAKGYRRHLPPPRAAALHVCRSSRHLTRLAVPHQHRTQNHVLTGPIRQQRQPVGFSSCASRRVIKTQLQSIYSLIPCTAVWASVGSHREVRARCVACSVQVTGDVRAFLLLCRSVG